MTVNKPDIGSFGWGVTLNAALDQLDAADVNTMAAVDIRVPRGSGTTLTAQPLPAINVRDYGAVGDGVTNDQPAIQAAIDAAAAAHLPCWFPPPPPGLFYSLGAALNVPAASTLIGTGNRGRRAILRSAVSNVLELSTGLGSGNVTIDGLQLHSLPGGGHCLYIGSAPSGGSTSFLTVRNFGMNQDNAGKSAVLLDVGEINEGLFSGGQVTHRTDATVPTFHFRSINAFNVNTLERIRFINSGNYSIHVESAGADFLQDLVIRSINFQQCLGGEIRLTSCRNVLIDGVAAYDATTYVKDRILIDKRATGPASINIHLRGVVRRGGSLDVGVVDVRAVAAEAARVTIQGVNGSIDLGNTSDNLILGLDASSPAGTVTNGGTTLVRLDAGSVTGRRYVASGTAGQGFYELTSNQASAPGTPTTGSRLYVDTNGGWRSISAGGFNEPVTDRLLPITSSSTARTLVATDAGNVINVTTTAGATTITVPPNSDVPFPIGTVITVRPYTTLGVTFAAGAGVTLRSEASMLSIRARYCEAKLTKRSADEWILNGDLV